MTGGTKNARRIKGDTRDAVGQVPRRDHDLEMNRLSNLCCMLPSEPATPQPVHARRLRRAGTPPFAGALESIRGMTEEEVEAAAIMNAGITAWLERTVEHTLPGSRQERPVLVSELYRTLGDATVSPFDLVFSAFRLYPDHVCEDLLHPGDLVLRDKMPRGGGRQGKNGVGGDRSRDLAHAKRALYH
jgi:hypothetical protein